MNEVNLIGNFTKEFVYSHTTNDIKFYSSILSVKRLSATIDEIEIITANLPDEMEHTYYVHGDIRAFNRHGHSKYYVYPDFMYQVEESFQNKVELIGYVETVSKTRRTPLGSYIKDVMLMVNKDEKTVRIPLILWNSLSKQEIIVGQELHIIGRLQSRIYTKNNISRKILEVSVNKII